MWILPTQAFTRGNFTQTLLHREVFRQRRFYKRETFSDRSVYTEKLLHREAFTQTSVVREQFYTEKLYADKFKHTKAAEFAAPKPDLCAEADKGRFRGTFSKIC